MESEQVREGAERAGAPAKSQVAETSVDQGPTGTQVSFSLPPGISSQAVLRFQDQVRTYGVEVLREATRIEDSRRLKGEDVPEITASIVAEAAQNPNIIGAEPSKNEAPLLKVGAGLAGAGAGAFASYLPDSGWNVAGFIVFLVLLVFFILSADYKFVLRRRDR